MTVDNSFMLCQSYEQLTCEDTRLSTALGIVESIKMVHFSTAEASNLLLLIATCVGYEPAILEMLLEALEVMEDPSPVIEVLPTILFGAPAEQIVQVYYAIKKALARKIPGVLVPALRALYAIALPPLLRRDALMLVTESLAAVEEDDVPTAVRTLAALIDVQSDAIILTEIYKHCSCLRFSALSSSVLTLASALTTYPHLARILLHQLQHITHCPREFDVLLLILLYAEATCQATVQSLFLRCLGTFPLLSQQLTSLASQLSSPSLATLVPSFLSLSKWIFFISLTHSRPTPAVPFAPAPNVARSLLTQLFLNAPSLRDDLLSCLLSSALDSFHACPEHAKCTVRTSPRHLLLIRQTAQETLATLAAADPNALRPYIGRCIDRVFSCVRVHTLPLVRPMLHLLASLQSTTADQSARCRLLNFVQEQLRVHAGPFSTLRSSNCSLVAQQKEDRAQVAALIMAAMLCKSWTEGGERLGNVFTYVLSTLPQASLQYAVHALRLLSVLIRPQILPQLDGINFRRKVEETLDLLVQRLGILQPLDILSRSAQQSLLLVVRERLDIEPTMQQGDVETQGLHCCGARPPSCLLKEMVSEGKLAWCFDQMGDLPHASPSDLLLFTHSLTLTLVQLYSQSSSQQGPRILQILGMAPLLLPHFNGDVYVKGQGGSCEGKHAVCTWKSLDINRAGASTPSGQKRRRQGEGIVPSKKHGAGICDCSEAAIEQKDPGLVIRNGTAALAAAMAYRGLLECWLELQEGPEESSEAPKRLGRILIGRYTEMLQRSQAHLKTLSKLHTVKSPTTGTGQETVGDGVDDLSTATKRLQTAFRACCGGLDVRALYYCIECVDDDMGGDTAIGPWGSGHWDALMTVKSLLEMEREWDIYASLSEGWIDRRPVVGDIITEHDCVLRTADRMIRQLNPLNQVLSRLRRAEMMQQRGNGPSACTIARLLCLYLGYLRQLYLRIAEQDIYKAPSVQARQEAEPVLLATLPYLFQSWCRGLLGYTAEPSEVLEHLYSYLSKELAQTEEEGVACGLLELLSCLTVGTWRVESTACCEALACLGKTYAIAEPEGQQLLGLCFGGTEPQTERPGILPVALWRVLQASFGAHELQTRILMRLQKFVLSPLNGLVEHPALRYLTLTFWSLLPPKQRAFGLLHLLQSLPPPNSASVTPGKARKCPLTRSPSQAPSLRALTPDACPAYVELISQLAISTLALARAEGLSKENIMQLDEEELSPYSGVQMALLCVVQCMKRAAKEAKGGEERLGQVMTQLCLMTMPALQWQVERCLAWRAARGGANEVEEDDEVGMMHELAREVETSLAAVKGLMESILGYIVIVLDLCKALRDGSSKAATSSKRSLTSAKKRGAAARDKRAGMTGPVDDNAEITIDCSGLGAQKPSVPRLLSGCHKLVAQLRGVCSRLRLPIKIPSTTLLPKKVDRKLVELLICDAAVEQALRRWMKIRRTYHVSSMSRELARQDNQVSPVSEGPEVEFAEIARAREAGQDDVQSEDSHGCREEGESPEFYARPRKHVRENLELGMAAEAVGRADCVGGWRYEEAGEDTEEEMVVGGLSGAKGRLVGGTMIIDLGKRCSKR